MSGTLRLITRHPGGMVTTEYRAADWRVEEGWLLVTHEDPGGKDKGKKLLSRVLVANIVQILEQLEEAKQ